MTSFNLSSNALFYTITCYRHPYQVAGDTETLPLVSILCAGCGCCGSTGVLWVGLECRGEIWLHCCTETQQAHQDLEGIYIHIYIRYFVHM